MRVLVADDEKTVLRTLGDAIAEKGHDVSLAASGDEAARLLEKERFDCVISDIRMPGLGGLELLSRIQDCAPGTDVILMTAYATVEQAVEAMKKGAYDYIAKPFMNDEVIVMLERIETLRNLRKENALLKETLGAQERFHELVGKSKRMQQVFELLRTVARTDSSVLIIGESGTGKELAAKAIHRQSSRSAGPLVRLSCAVFPEGLLEDELFGHVKGAFTDARQTKKGRFEEASGGTIFLDDIDDMSLKTQVKLLRVLQEKEFEMLGSTKTLRVDIRVIAATKKDLAKMASDGLFREDLYYRLHVVPVQLPPLRDHREDIPLLAEHFLKKYGKDERFTLAPEALAALLKNGWPGNVRQLENTIERGVSLSGEKRVIGLEQLFPGEIMSEEETSPHSLLLKDAVEKAEKRAIEISLKAAEGEKGRSAQLLGISRKTLWEKIKYYKIKKDVSG